MFCSFEKKNKYKSAFLSLRVFLEKYNKMKTGWFQLTKFFCSNLKVRKTTSSVIVNENWIKFSCLLHEPAQRCTSSVAGSEMNAATEQWPTKFSWMWPAQFQMATADWQSHPDNNLLFFYFIYDRKFEIWKVLSVLNYLFNFIRFKLIRIFHLFFVNVSQSCQKS